MRWKNVNDRNVNDLLEISSVDLRNGQQSLANNARQIDLPQNEITRIKAGDFTESETARIEDAKRVLRESSIYIISP